MKRKKQKTDVPATDPPPDTAADTPAVNPESQLLRLRAAFDNFRKRTLREKDELYRRAHEDLMTDLLPVLDHLELGLAAARDHDADESFVEGVRMVADQLVGVLQAYGLNPVETDGVEFDPHVHEAIAHLPSDTVPAGRVMESTRKGYRLADRLLRAAQTVVSSGPAAGAPETPANAADAAETPPAADGNDTPDDG